MGGAEGRLDEDEFYGARCVTSKLATCGGLIRDENGLCMGGFFRKFGICSILVIL